MLRALPLSLLLASFICYFEWGNHSAFLLEMECEILSGGNGSSLVHPLIIAPALGQLLLIYSIFKPNRRITLAGMALLAVLVLMILLAGVFGNSLKMVLSVFPFFIISGIFIRNYRKRKPQF